MFRIGEFSQIARVSARLLRYYESLGLLKPIRTDSTTGYRYYSASQLPRLNRILALKELGLSLDQIAKLVDDSISPDEIRGMLTLKKAELEQSLREETTRLRSIESRLAQIERQGAMADYDVVIKSAPAQPFLSVRRVFPTMDRAVDVLRDVALTVTSRVAPQIRDRMTVVAHSDFEDDHLDLEIGFCLTRDFDKRVALGEGMELSARELPAADSLATLVRSGPNYQSHLTFGDLGVWMEAHNYQVDGPCREVFLEVPFLGSKGEEPIVEIQFPVTKVV